MICDKSRHSPLALLLTVGATVAFLIALSIFPLSASAASASARAPKTSLDVVVSGLPIGIHASIVVRGPGRLRKELNRTTVLTRVRPGTYTLVMNPVKIVRQYRTIKAGSVATPTNTTIRVTVKAHQRATVQAAYGTIRNSNVKPLTKLPLSVQGPTTNPTAIVVLWEAHPVVGAILTQMPTTTLPDGLFDIVTKVQHIGGKAVLSLRPAALTDAFPELNVDYSAPLKPLPSTPSPGATGNARAADTTLTPLSLNWGDVSASCSFPLSTAYSFSAGETFSASDYARADVSFHWLYPFVGASGRLELYLNGSAALGFKLPSGPGCELRGNVIGPLQLDVGGIPITATVSIVAGIGTGKDGFSADVSSGQVGLAAGFAFNTNSSPVVNGIAWGTVTGPYIHTSGGGTVSFGPEISVGIGVDHLNAGLDGDVKIALTDGSSGCGLGLEESLSAHIDAGPFSRKWPVLGPFVQPLANCSSSNGGGNVSPINTAPPSLSTTSPQEGEALSVSSGTWIGSPTPTIVYQWDRCDATGKNCSNISGAIAQTYTPSAADLGSTLEAEVTANNSVGSATTSTPASSIVTGPLPANTAQPALSTSGPQEGVPLSVDNGTWINTPTSYAYLWLRCSDASGKTCTAISGATTYAYTPTSADVGGYLQAQVTAINNNGRGTAFSHVSNVVTAASQGGGQGAWSAPLPIDSLFTSVSCATVSFCVAVGPGGDALTYNGTSWTTPAYIDSTHIDSTSGSLTSVSCPTTTFCVAVDSGGYALTYNGTSWTTPAHIDNTGSGLSSVSCSSATFCVAVGDGSALTYNGSSWSASDGIVGTSSSVSCPSAAFCVAVNYEGDAVTYNGTSWSAPAQIDNSGGSLDSVSCASASFCVAVDNSGYAVTYNGTSWTTTANIEGGIGGLSSVSCPTVSFCVAVGDGGYAVTYNGTSWTTPANIDNSRGLTSVSCPTTSFCAAVDYYGYAALTYNGTSWTTPAHIGGGRGGLGGFSSVSCATTTFCAAVDNGGYAVTYNGTSWTTPANIDSWGVLFGGFSSVSCATTTFCAAVGGGGDALTYNGTSWTTPAHIGAANLTSVSCPTVTFCAAVDGYGYALTYTGTSWTTPAYIDNSNTGLGGFSSVSCATATFCTAVDSGGYALTYNSTSWSTPAHIDGGSLTSVSCATVSFCVAVGPGGDALTYNGTSWSTPVSIDGNGSLRSVSCVSASFCAAVDYYGYALTYNGTSWTTPARIDNNTLRSVSCPTATFCTAVDSEGHALTYTK
jgi:hypothetical protein